MKNRDWFIVIDADGKQLCTPQDQDWRAIWWALHQQRCEGGPKTWSQATALGWTLRIMVLAGSLAFEDRCLHNVSSRNAEGPCTKCQGGKK